MSTATSPSPRHSRPRPPLPGFGRFVLILVVALAGSIAWRSAAIHLRHGKGSRLASTPVAGGGGAATRSALDRFSSLGYPVLCGGGHERLVALTFDDGPGPYTGRTVDILRTARARATFFIVGRELVDWPGLGRMPAIERTVGALGDHTWDHPDLTTLPPSDLAGEIERTKTAVEHASGTSVRLFRPPYGKHDPDVDGYVKSLGMVEVLWTVDSGDGLAGATGPGVLQTVLDGLRPGAIVLMHENRGTTLGILPTLLRDISARGYRTVTVPELLAVDPPSLAQLHSGRCG